VPELIGIQQRYNFIIIITPHRHIISRHSFNKNNLCDTWIDIETRTCSYARIRRAWVISSCQLWVVLRSRIPWFKMATAGQHPPALKNTVPRKARLQLSYSGAAEQIFLTKTGLWCCDRGPLSLTFHLTSVRASTEEQRTAHSYVRGELFRAYAAVPKLISQWWKIMTLSRDFFQTLLPKKLHCWITWEIEGNAVRRMYKLPGIRYKIETVAAI